MRRQLYEVIIEVDHIVKENPFGVHQSEVAYIASIDMYKSKRILEGLVSIGRITKEGRIYLAGVD